MATSPPRKAITSGSKRPERSACGGRRRACEDSGQSLVEFALIFPMLMLIVLGIVDLGRGYMAWNTLQNSAREGARVAAVDPSATTITNRAKATATTLNQSNMNVSLTCSVDNGTTFGTCAAGSSWSEGDIVRVRVTYAYKFATPLGWMVGLGTSLNEAATAEARFEGQ